MLEVAFPENVEPPNAWTERPSFAKATVEIEEIAIVLIAKTEERERVHFCRKNYLGEAYLGNFYCQEILRIFLTLTN